MKLRKQGSLRLLLIVMCVTLLMPLSLVRAQDATHPASPIAGDGSGPIAVTGVLSVANFAAAEIFQKPTVALLDITSGLPQTSGAFVSDESQILGFATSPFFQADTPGTYEVRLPIEPSGAAITFGDDNGDGVQVFQMTIGNNLTGNSYLQQLEQSGLSSVLYDSLTGNLVLGNLLAYASEDDTLFPTGSGADGQWFTGDDELSPLKAGYTVVHLAADGTSTTDRSAMPSMDIVEDPAEASLDLSNEGILDSFNALIDRLAERYAFTELRELDWEALRAQYLPMVQEADANDDMVEYTSVLSSLSDGIHDAHVTLAPTTAEAEEAFEQVVDSLAVNFTASVGAKAVFMLNPDDPEDVQSGTVQVLTVGETGPARDAGWVSGTEILSVDGKTMAERRAEIPTVLAGKSLGTEANLALVASQLVLLFAPGQQVTVEYRLPDDDQVRSVSMTAGDYPSGEPVSATREWPADSAYYEKVSDHTVIHWNEFTENFPTKVAILEEALKAEAKDPSLGIILDMRGNSGGWEGGYLTLASYFFSADAPLQYPIFDAWTYDEATGGMVKTFVAPYSLSSPNPDLTFSGPLTVLIDAQCASSCEFFTQTLQKTGRAQVVGQFATAGAGGNVDQVTMPGGFIFQYTVGRSYYADTQEPNIERKGVTPDIWLPHTIQNALDSYSDLDLVLNMAIAAITPAQDMGTPTAGSPVPDVEASPAT